jgi:hypothetical protein
MKDVDEILGHPWFADVDIDAILNKREAAPFVPKIEGIRDLSNFDPEVVNQNLKESILPEESINLIRDKHDAFRDFGTMQKTDLTHANKLGSSDNSV